MASSYALPSSGLPLHAHHQHIHSHSHSHSHPTAPLNALRSTMNGEPNSHGHGETPSHNHNHGHSHSVGGGHSHSHTHAHSNTNGHAVQAQKRIPPKSLSSLGGWTTESTAGGRTILTPTSTNFPSYEPPDQSGGISHVHHGHNHSHDHGHDHGHDHNHGQHEGHHDHHDHTAERSIFTGLVLRYTSGWPLLHTIMTDKDSRRILYFMRFVELVLLCCWRTVG